MSTRLNIFGKIQGQDLAVEIISFSASDISFDYINDNINIPYWEDKSLIDGDYYNGVKLTPELLGVVEADINSDINKQLLRRISAVECKDMEELISIDEYVRDLNDALCTIDLLVHIITISDFEYLFCNIG